jgi:hypothetical protein
MPRHKQVRVNPGKRWTKGSKIQTLIFDKSYFTRGEAKQWAKDNGFKIGVDEKANTYRLRQLPPSKFADMRTITLTEGVKAVVGPMKNPRRRRRNPPKVAYTVRDNHNWKTYDLDPQFDGYDQILIYRNERDNEKWDRRRGMYVFGVDSPLSQQTTLWDFGSAMKMMETGRLTELAYVEGEFSRGKGAFESVLKELGYFPAGFKDEPKPEGIWAGEHPDLFEGDSPMYLDWREMPDHQLVVAASRGRLSDDVIEEIEEEDDELFAKVAEADDEAREGRIEPIVKSLRGEAEWFVEYETEGDGLEGYQDVFQEWLHGADRIELFEEAMKALKEAGREIEFADEYLAMDRLDDVLRDPSAFEISTSDSYYFDAVYSLHLDYRDWEIDPSFWDFPLKEIEERAFLYGWPRPSDAKLINKEVDNASLSGLDGVLAEMYEDHDVTSGMSMSVHMGIHILWNYDVSMIESDFVEVAEEMGGTKPLGELIEKSGKDVDDVVYDDLPDGFYVADLPAEALPMEGRKQGICVGRRDMGYIGRVQREEIKILSLRTAGGKPKFTIEVELDEDGEPIGVEQIKGKANRLPGFAAGAYGELTKPQEVEMLGKFVEEHLGIDPEDVADLRPGWKALQAWKESQPRKNPSLPDHIPVPKSVQKLAKKAYNEPWGGEW